MIKLSDLKSGKAPSIEEYVLSAFKDGQGCECMSRWDVSMAVFYNQDNWNYRYVGWFSLKDLPPMRTDIPEAIKREDGSVNSVLALAVNQDERFSDWHVCNTVYYRMHPKEYKGWIELENITDTPEPKKAAEYMTKEERAVLDKHERLEKLLRDCQKNGRMGLDWEWLSFAGKLCGNDRDIFDIKCAEYEEPPDYQI